MSRNKKPHEESSAVSQRLVWMVRSSDDKEQKSLSTILHMVVCPPKHVDVIMEVKLDRGSIPRTSTYYEKY